MTHIALLANGAPPQHPLPRRLLAEADRLVCCDGAAATARRLGRTPDLVVGDGDSLAEADRRALGGRFVHVAEQDTNDLAKAFRIIVARAARPARLRLSLLGATGRREDHALGNIFRLVAFAAVVPRTALYTDTGVFEVVRGARAFACVPGAAVSVFAPQPGTAVASRGLQWPLAGVPLADLWAGTLNRATGRRFVLRADRPVLVYREYARAD